MSGKNKKNRLSKKKKKKNIRIDYLKKSKNRPSKNKSIRIIGRVLKRKSIRQTNHLKD